MRGVAVQEWRPLIGLAAHEAVEIVEAHPSGPLVERSGGAVLVVGRVVVLAEPRRGIAVLLQDFANGGVVDANNGVVARIARGLLGNDPETNGVMVTPGNDRRPRRRTERGGMELRIAQSHLRYAVHGGGRNDAAERACDPIPLIVGHDQQDIRCAFGRHDLRRPVGLGVLGVEADLATERRRRIGKVVAVDSRGGARRSRNARRLLGGCHWGQRRADEKC